MLAAGLCFLGERELCIAPPALLGSRWRGWARANEAALNDLWQARAHGHRLTVGRGAGSLLTAVEWRAACRAFGRVRRAGGRTLAFAGPNELREMARRLEDVALAAPAGFELFLAEVDAAGEDGAAASDVPMALTSGSTFAFGMGRDDDGEDGEAPPATMFNLHWDEYGGGRCHRAATGDAAHAAEHAPYVVVSAKFFALLGDLPASGRPDPSSWASRVSWLRMSGVASTECEVIGFGPVAEHARLGVLMGGSGIGIEAPAVIDTWTAAAESGGAPVSLKVVVALREEERGFIGDPSCPLCRGCRVDLVVGSDGRALPPSTR